MGAFEEAIDEARKLEKKLVEYGAYGGEVEIARTLDLEPRDYVDLTYTDMLNQYGRTQKIISATGRGVFAAMPGEEKAEAPKPAATAATQEVESRLREMTTETLKSAEEVSRQVIELEKAAPPPQAEAAPAGPQKLELEFEHRPAEKEIELERGAPAKPGVELEREARPQAAQPEAVARAPERPMPAPPVPEAVRGEPAIERPAAPEALAPEEKKIIVAAVPPALKESPDEAAARKYAKMEEQIRAALGEKADEVTLKKKMLELTKELFKEKSIIRRNELKAQITVLKNMLSGAGKPAKKAAKGADETHQKIFEALLSSQQADLAQTKDSIIGSYNRQLSTIKQKFYSDMELTEDPAKRKQIFDSFAFSVTSLVEQLPEVLEKYRDFTIKKHSSEMEKLRGSTDATEKATMRAVEDRLAYIKAKYDQEFAPVKGIIAHEIDTLVEVAGAEVFKKEEKPEEAEAKEYEAVKDINDTDEGTLLYYLRTKDADFYKMYERNQISKAEAIFKAKEVMAREKGLSDAMVRKYFTHTEG